MILPRFKLIDAVEIKLPSAFDKATLELLRVFSVVDLAAIIPELLFRMSARIIILPFVETNPDVIILFEGLVLELFIIADLMVKSLPARISEDAELVRLAALMIKLSADCRVELFSTFPLALMLKIPPEEIFETLFFSLVRFCKFNVRFLSL